MDLLVDRGLFRFLCCMRQSRNAIDATLKFSETLRRRRRQGELRDLADDLRGTDTIDIYPETRRLSCDHDDGVAATWHRVDAIDATSS